MAKIYGEIGYAELKETAPGVWTECINPRNYYCELVRNTRRLQTTGNLNDDITISNEISVLADPYAYENYHSMRYVEFMGTKWKVISVEVQYPRLVLMLGGVYNG